MKKLYDRSCAAEAVIAGTLLVLAVALIFLGGVRVLGYPLNWSTDFATAFFAWACFLCADIAWRRNALHVHRLPREPAAAQGAAAVRYANYAIIAGFLVYLMVMGTWLAWTSRARSFQGIPRSATLGDDEPAGRRRIPLATTFSSSGDSRKPAARGRRVI